MEHSEWCHSVIGCSEPGHCTCPAWLDAVGASLDETPEQRAAIEAWHASRKQEG